MNEAAAIFRIYKLNGPMIPVLVIIALVISSFGCDSTEKSARDDTDGILWYCDRIYREDNCDPTSTYETETEYPDVAIL